MYCDIDVIYEGFATTTATTIKPKTFCTVHDSVSLLVAFENSAVSDHWILVKLKKTTIFQLSSYRIYSIVFWSMLFPSRVSQYACTLVFCCFPLSHRFVLVFFISSALNVYCATFTWLNHDGCIPVRLHDFKIAARSNLDTQKLYTTQYKSFEHISIDYGWIVQLTKCRMLIYWK